MTLFRRLLLSLLVLAPAGATSLAAQLCNTAGAGPISCTVNVTTSLTIPVILRMTIGSGTTSFGTLTSADYDLGSKTVAGPAVTIKANQGWRTQLSSAATFWTATGTGARATKPTADLLWGSTSGGGFTAVSGTATQIGSGSGTGGTVVPLFFQSVWSYAVDTPGNYSIVVTFTLVSP
jgi:hypothetical protein